MSLGEFSNVTLDGDECTQKNDSPVIDPFLKYLGIITCSVILCIIFLNTQPGVSSSPQMYSKRQIQTGLVIDVGKRLETYLINNSMEPCVGAADIGLPWSHVVYRHIFNNGTTLLQHLVNIHVDPHPDAVSFVAHVHVPTCYGETNTKKYQSLSRVRYDSVYIDYIDLLENNNMVFNQSATDTISACVQHYNEQGTLPACHQDL